MSDKVKEFLERHPYPKALGVHPIWWAARLGRTLRCKNFDKERQECQVCTDYEKQEHECFEEC